jgi:D-3-phosphoglycerate dehydrogenase
MTKPVVIQAFPIMHPDGDQLLRSAVDLRTLTALDPETIIREGEGAVAIIGRTPLRIDGPILDALPDVRVLSATGSGADCFDLPAATARGIPVLHNPGVAPAPIVEYVLGAMVFLMKRLREADAVVRRGGAWEPKEQFAGGEVTGATLGLIGLGHIGGEVARRARAAFDVRVVAFDPIASDEQFKAAGAERHILDDVLAQADIVSLHVPLIESTRQMLSSAQFALMKPGAVLVNASRGGVVDEDALVDALRQGHISAAAVDVFATEPPAADHPLFAFPQVITTPHIAGLSQNSMRNLALAVATNVIGALKGKRPPHVMNPSAWPPARRAGDARTQVV